MSILFLKMNSSVQLPTRRDGDVGYDLYYPGPNIELVSAFSVDYSGPSTLRLSFATAFSDNLVAIIKDRSGNAAKKGLHCLAGVIDSSYRGEWGVVLVNLSTITVTVSTGDRIAQVLFLPCFTPEWEEVTSLPISLRGSQGFGASGQ
jgi:dUTP pyrophosphatase